MIGFEKEYFEHDSSEDNYFVEYQVEQDNINYEKQMEKYQKKLLKFEATKNG